MATFNYKLQIAAADGRFDRIELDKNIVTLPIVGIDADSDALQELANRFAITPKNLRGLNADGGFGFICNRPRGYDMTTGEPVEVIELKIRPRAFGSIPPPLFSGKVRLVLEGQVIQATARLNLNPTRYIRHHVCPAYLRPRSIVGSGVESRWSAWRKLFKSGASWGTGGEFAYDGNDNWLTMRNGVLACEPAAFKQHTREYMREAFKLLHDELVKAAERAQFFILPRNANGNLTASSLAVVPRDGSGSLQQLEVHWEFAVTDPTGEVEALIPICQSYSASSAIDRPSLDTGEEGLSIRMNLKSGVTLKIYAKTNRRIRFEILFKFKDVRDMNRTFDSIEALNGRMELVRRKAAEMLQKFFNFAATRETGYASQRITPIYVLLYVLDACYHMENPVDSAHELMRTLTSVGQIQSDRTHPFYKALRTLKSRGVLRVTQNSNIYSPSSRALQAVQWFNEAGRLNRFMLPEVLANLASQ